MKITNLETALKAIKRIKKNAQEETVRVYTADDCGWSWYFSVSGFMADGRYFDIYLMKSDDSKTVTVEPSSTTDVELAELTAK